MESHSSYQFGDDKLDFKWHQQQEDVTSPRESTNGFHYNWSSGDDVPRWNPLGDLIRCSDTVSSSIYSSSTAGTAGTASTAGTAGTSTFTPTFVRDPFPFEASIVDTGRSTTLFNHEQPGEIRSGYRGNQETFIQYDPFLSQPLSPRQRLMTSQPPTPVERSYSDVIRSTERHEGRAKIAEARSPPLDQTSSRTQTSGKTRSGQTASTETRTSEDMFQEKPSNSGKENHDVRKLKTDSEGFTKPNKTQKEPKTKEEPFWDPKRIFQPKKSQPKEKSSSSRNQGPPLLNEVLNNGKCTSGFITTNKTAFINNNLQNRSQTRKKNNVTPETPEQKPTKPEPTPSFHESGTSDGQPSRTNEHTRSGNETESKGKKVPEVKKSTGKSKSKVTSKSTETVSRARVRRMRQWAREKFWMYGWPALKFVPIVVLQILVLLFTILFYYAVRGFTRIRPYLNFKLFGAKKSELSDSAPEGAYAGGLECNIDLPSTGDEAIQRLLGCEGKDPYCILGLHSGCTDDDVKRYYRKQAILVHPDKNHDPGAEEAFKVLHYAFEQIGTPEKRKTFDTAMRDSKAADESVKLFGDLLKKYETKLREAANRMRCETCQGTHQRVPVPRSIYDARYCSQCREHHIAREGDCWVETTSFGFYWTYYACMDGGIYNITEWVRCQGNMFEKMQPGAHHVIYTLVTGTNQRKHQTRATSSGSGDTNMDGFEDLLKHMAGGGSPRDYDPQGSHDPRWSKKRATRGKKRRR